jgi:predicted RNA binding protein with dsRBD fold (UPF0201 family)/cytidylate kinase
MKLIAFVGYPLSGKSTASKIAKELGIPVVVMGDVIRDELRKRGLEVSDENAGRIANELREKEGMDAIAKRCIPLIREAGKNSGVVVVDGIRGIAEVERFKKEFGDDFILIGIESSAEKRLERAKERGREDDVSTLEELKTRDKREESWGLKEALEASDLTIENESDVESFKEKVEAVLKEFLKGIEIEITTKIYPTEDEQKVISAIKNFFPDAIIEIKSDDGGALKAKAKDLTQFRDLLRKQRILDTARQEMLRNVSGNEITIFLNKQTATISRINFSDEDAILSPITVTFKVYGVDVQRFIDYLAPQTRAGKPVKEIDDLFE